eukprot:m.579722 g.579722  ORF g.579722 m.579722 type:complete len:658 (+) comp22317_c0_seq3:316-2289(+)
MMHANGLAEVLDDDYAHQPRDVQSRTRATVHDVHPYDDPRTGGDQEGEIRSFGRLSALSSGASSPNIDTAGMESDMHSAHGSSEFLASDDASVFLPVKDASTPKAIRNDPGGPSSTHAVRVVQPWGGGTRARVPTAAAASLGSTMYPGRFSGGGHHYQRLTTVTSGGDAGHTLPPRVRRLSLTSSGSSGTNTSHNLHRPQYNTRATPEGGVHDISRASSAAGAHPRHTGSPGDAPTAGLTGTPKGNFHPSSSTRPTRTPSLTLMRGGIRGSLVRPGTVSESPAGGAVMDSDGNTGVWSGGAKHASLHQHSLALSRRSSTDDTPAGGTKRPSQSVPSSPPRRTSPPPLFPRLSPPTEHRAERRQTSRGAGHTTDDTESNIHAAVHGRSHPQRMQSALELEHHGSNRSPRKQRKSRARTSSASVSESPRGEKSSGSNKGHLFKVLVVGNSGVGKTSIIKRYAHNLFSDQYAPTIGVDFALKALTTGIGDEETVVRLQLWDIAGQEQFGAMTRVYYKGAVGAFVVFDVSQKDDGKSIQGWKQDIDEKVRLNNGDNIPVVLLANKCDMEEWSWTPEAIDALCVDMGFRCWFDVSAKEKINVNEAHSYLVRQMLKNVGLAEKDLYSVRSACSPGRADDGLITVRKSRLDINGEADMLNEKCC